MSSNQCSKCTFRLCNSCAENFKANWKINGCTYFYNKNTKEYIVVYVNNNTQFEIDNFKYENVVQLANKPEGKCLGEALVEGKYPDIAHKNNWIYIRR